VKLDQLTFTRYIAALSVVFFHYGAHVFPANIPWLNPILAAGPIAVSYFYVLSGFIMAIAYYRPDNTAPFKSGRYWLARFARVYPIYFLALLLMIGAKIHDAGSDPLTVTLSLSMLQAWVPGYPLTLNAPGWSISVEMFFYLCFPLLMLMVKRHHLPWLTLGMASLWLSTQMLHTYLLNTTDYKAFNALHDFIYYHPIMHLNTFLMGFVAGVWLHLGKFQYFTLPRVNTISLLAVLSLTLLLLGLRETFIADTGIAIDYTNGLIAPLFIGLIILLALNTSKLSDWLSHKWLVLLGEASFSLYILQKPLYGIYNSIFSRWLDTASAGYFYLFLILLTAVAILSFQWIETPFRRFINAFGSSSDKSGEKDHERGRLT
jgi:peptidoglycan/LPS O-acetylase OafA/YrhL